MIVTFTIPGAPVAKGRARAFRTKFGVGHYTPEKTRAYEAAVRSIAAEAMGDMPPMDGPVTMVLRAFFSAPKSLKKADRELVAKDALPVIKKPDVDNITKAVSDGMNGIVYKDDSQVFAVAASKFYSERPRVEVEIASREIA